MILFSDAQKDLLGLERDNKRCAAYLTTAEKSGAVLKGGAKVLVNHIDYLECLWRVSGAFLMVNFAPSSLKGRGCWS